MEAFGAGINDRPRLLSGGQLRVIKYHSSSRTFLLIFRVESQLKKNLVYCRM
jgi:hypothetical protein